MWKTHHVGHRGLTQGCALSTQSCIKEEDDYDQSQGQSKLGRCAGDLLDGRSRGTT